MSDQLKYSLDDISSYPAEFTSLLISLDQEVDAIHGAGWHQKAKQMITRYSLAACLLGMIDLNLTPILQKSFNQLEGVEIRVLSSKTFDKNFSDRLMWIGLQAIQEIGVRMKDEAAYTRQLTNNVHALYSKAMNRRSFIADTGGIIQKQLLEAWTTGADEMMVLPEDMTAEDNSFINGIIATEQNYLDSFADDIQDASANKTGWEAFKFRIGLWVNRLKEVENKARAYFGGKQKLKWRLGKTEKHCNKCKKLNGIVAFSTEWAQVDMQPQFHMGCDCDLIPTSERKTQNAVKRILAIKEMELVMEKEHNHA